MKIRWGEVFAFPVRSPWVLLQLWLLHWLPLLAVLPLLFTGALTVAAGALTTQHQIFKWPTLALGLSTFGAYLFFVTTALFVGFYPVGYMLELMKSVSQGGDRPLPLGRWLPRAGKGFYYGLLCVLGCIPPYLVLTLAAGGGVLLCQRAQFGPAVSLVMLGLGVVVALLVGLALLLYQGGVFLRLARSLNPFYVLNPVAVLADIGRGWLDYLVSHAFMFGLVIFLIFLQITVQLAAVFTGLGPFVLLPGLILGLVGNYCVLAAAQASGQYVRHFVR